MSSIQKKNIDYLNHNKASFSWSDDLRYCEFLWRDRASVITDQ